MSARQVYDECQFCVRPVGMQGGKFRPHKHSDEIYVCPASGLTPPAAQALFDTAAAEITAATPGQTKGPR